MGMDLVGRRPDNEKGEYLRNNIWWWHGLWSYCLHVAPETARKVKHPWTNDGDGLGKKDSLTLAKALRRELAEGRTAAYGSKDDFFSSDNVERFAEFLEHCGGFKIC